MSREERREGEDPGVPGYPGWTPPQNALRSAGFFAGAGERERQEQDFLAGTVFAAGAGVLFAGDALAPDAAARSSLPTPFTVYVHEDERTWGPAPQLRELFALLDERGGSAVYEDVLSKATTGWGLFDHPTEPLVKLRLDFRPTGVLTGSAEIVLMAANYAEQWRWIARGGLVAISGLERMQAVAARPGASMADGLESSLLAGVGGSPALQAMLASHGWPQ